MEMILETMETLLETIAKIFDDCDNTHSGKVHVSKLISVVKDEVSRGNMSIQDDHQQQKDEILESIQCLLDSCHQDVEVDRDTWLKAWKQFVESQEINGNVLRNTPEEGDHCSSSTSVDSPSVLNQSKQSYCFSPGSRTSSVESEPEELITFRKQNEKLLKDCKGLKQQIQTLEDSMTQDQAEYQEREKSLLGQVNRLTKQNEKLAESITELRSSLVACEKEKLELCSASTNQCMAERDLKLQIDDLIKQVTSLESDIGELNCVLVIKERKILDLDKDLRDQRKIFLEKIEKLECDKQAIEHEKNEMSLKLSTTLLDKKIIALKLEEYELYEKQNRVQMSHTLSVPSPVYLEQDKSREDDVPHLPDSDAPLPPPELPNRTTNLVNNLHEEIEAVGSFIYNSNSDLDSSDDEERLVGESVFENHTLDILTTAFDSDIKQIDESVVALPESQASVEGSRKSENIFSNKNANDENIFQNEGSGEGITLLGKTKCCLLCEKVGKEMKVDQETQTFTQNNNCETQTENNTIKADQSTQIEIQTHDINIQTDHHLFLERLNVQNINIFHSKIDQRLSREILLTDLSIGEANKAKRPLPLQMSSYPNHEILQRMTEDFGTQTEHPSPNVFVRWRYGLVACVLICLLAFMTILCTGAILEIATESGILAFPFSGTTSPWIKRIVKPFIKIHIPEKIV